MEHVMKDVFVLELVVLPLVLVETVTFALIRNVPSVQATSLETVLNVMAQPWQLEQPHVHVLVHLYEQTRMNYVYHVILDVQHVHREELTISSTVPLVNTLSIQETGTIV